MDQKAKRMLAHIIIPAFIAVFAYMLYFLAHVNSDYITIPKGYDDGREIYEPLKNEPLIQFWKSESFKVAGWSLGVSVALSALYYYIRKPKAGLRDGVS